MAYPNDLSDVTVFKVHPAIGVARLANNDDVYEFFDYQNKRAAGQGATLKYMSVKNGKHWMMRQAVRFRIFAYDQSGNELGELSEAVRASLGIDVTWRAAVANRKLNLWSGGETAAVTAQATASGDERVDLEGKNPWRDGKVWLGTLTGKGVFIPPKGGAYRKSNELTIPPYGQHRSDNGILDTTSDGAIEADLTGIGARPVIAACVIVAPQDHSPDVFAREIGNTRNRDFIKETRKLLQIPQGATVSGKGMAMDVAMMDTMNAEYKPGMEICLEEELIFEDFAVAFHPPGEGHIAANEIRPRYIANEVEHGSLTAGLCSAWQTDLNACLDYWTAEFPAKPRFATPPERRSLARPEYELDPADDWNDPEMLNLYMDMMGVGRNENNDPISPVERERGPGDNVGAVPSAPFPLEAPR